MNLLNQKSYKVNHFSLAVR